VADVVSLAYYPNEEGQGHNRGQLHTVTDALGHVTTSTLETIGRQSGTSMISMVPNFP